MQNAPRTMMSCQETAQQVTKVPNQPTNLQIPQGIEMCVREGCNNPAVASEEWQEEYCSQQCVVQHCNDIFSAWVASNLQENAEKILQM